jgi:beta-lactamase class A
MKRQQYKDGIGRHTLDGVEVASKSGALDALRSDVGIAWTSGGAVALAITVDDLQQVDYSPDNAGNRLISDLTELILTDLGAKAPPNGIDVGGGNPFLGGSGPRNLQLSARVTF